MSFGVSLDMSLLLKIPETLAAAAERAVEQTVDQAVSLAQENAHVVTGAMRAGVYGVTSQKSGYAAAVSAAMSADRKVKILPEVGPVQPGEGIVSDVTEQSIFEEFGTSKHGPHAFLGPAALAAEPLFVSNLEREAGNALR